MKTIDELKAERMPEEGRAERIAKSLAALHAESPKIELTNDQWREIMAGDSEE